MGSRTCTAWSSILHELARCQALAAAVALEAAPPSAATATGVLVETRLVEASVIAAKRIGSSVSCMCVVMSSVHCYDSEVRRPPHPQRSGADIGHGALPGGREVTHRQLREGGVRRRPAHPELSDWSRRCRRAVYESIRCTSRGSLRTPCQISMHPPFLFSIDEKEVVMFILSSLD